IETALRESDFFILLASPGAADSRWVAQELEWWRQHRSADHLLLVLTGGEFAWDRDRGDVDWSRTTALPRELSGFFPSEPLFLDLRWADRSSELSLRNPVFANAVARLAAPLHGLPLDDLISEEIRQQRHRVRGLAGALIALSILSAAALFAVFQGNRAWQLSHRLATREESNDAVLRNQALARHLAAESQRARATNQDLALLLAREALTASALPESESAARQALSGNSEILLRLPGSRDQGSYAQFSPDGSRVLSWGDATARLLDSATGQPVVEIRGHKEEILDAAFYDEGRSVVTAAEDGTVRLWDPSQGTERLQVEHPGVTSAQVGLHGTRLLTLAAGGDALLWDTTSRKQLAVLPLADSSIFADLLASFPTTGDRLALVTRRGPVLVDAPTGTTRIELPGHPGGTRSIAFSPDAQWVVTTGNDHAVRLWQAATGQPGRVVNPDPEAGTELREARFSPDGTRLAIRTSQPSVVLWDLAHDRVVARLALDAESGSPARFAFSPNSRCLITAGSDTDTAELWEVSTGSRLAQLTGGEGVIRTLSFAPDSQRVVIGSLFAPARVYACVACGDAGQLLDAARQRVPRALTPEERAKYQPPSRDPR
ncbi:MAG: hypothetical protein IT580_16950, partial [Verrucomicrobiales bacterium]|nr:hypothetical protein [Verrucomicrobiales bacterium]